MAEDPHPLVHLTVRGAVAVVELADPERRNVLSADLVAALSRAVSEAEATDGVLALVLTGQGSAFCAGAELDVLARSAQGPEAFEDVVGVYEGFLAVLRSPLASIAAVNGPAVGAGINLALACDVRLACPSAVFDTRFAALRLHPGGGHTWLLQRAVGYQQAVLACLFGQRWDAEAALAAGLVAAVHPPEDLVEQAVALGQRLDGLEPAFVRRLTATLRTASQSQTHQEVLAVETDAQRWSVTQPAFVDGVAAIQAAVAARSARAEPATSRRRDLRPPGS